MASHTVYLSKLFGLYFILCALAGMLHKQAVIDAVTSFLNNSPALWFFGIVLIIAGLAIILAHNLWSGGALTVVVTLLGWLTLLKGLFFVFVPMHSVADIYLRVLRYQHLFYLYAATLLVLGLYLAYAGFRSKSA